MNIIKTGKVCCRKIGILSINKRRIKRKKSWIFIIKYVFSNTFNIIGMNSYFNLGRGCPIMVCNGDASKGLPSVIRLGIIIMQSYNLSQWRIFQHGLQNIFNIGSLHPWLEALLLLKGASQITTFDYNKIRNEHPQIETLLPIELSERFFSGQRFDVMATYSSIEHSGLGRWTLYFSKLCDNEIESHCSIKDQCLASLSLWWVLSNDFHW